MCLIMNISGLFFKVLFFFIYGILIFDYIGIFFYRGVVNLLNFGLGDFCLGFVRVFGFVFGWDI